jgi:hypothetical protein
MCDSLRLVIAIEEYIHFLPLQSFPRKNNGLSPVEYREKAAASYTLFLISA